MKILSRILQEWDMALIIVFHILFGYLSLYIVFFFCIALTKSISHKNTIATLIGVASAIIIFVVWFVVGDKLDQLPIFTYYLFGSKSSFITYIFDFIVISALFIGTSWLMEKRIEH